MGLLQGPRLMAWTTKSPILGNHWVPLGCRVLLGSVKQKCRKFYYFRLAQNQLNRNSLPTYNDFGTYMTVGLETEETRLKMRSVWD